MSTTPGFYLSIVLIYILASVDCDQWWNNLGISYANNEESDANQQKFNDFYYNRHPFTDKSGPEFTHFARKFRTGQERRGESQVPRAGQRPISLAVQSKRTLQIIPYNVETEETKPQVIEITSKPMPIRLNFNTFSSPLDIQQTMQQNNDNKVEEKTFNARPHRMRHEVIKPVIQEVNEFIQPFRHIVQRIEPMIENIRTIVPESVDNTHRQWDQSNTQLSTDMRAQHNSNQFINRFNNGFDSHSMGNERQNSRDITNPLDSDHSYDNQQRLEQGLDTGSDFSESNRRTNYRILPIVIRRTNSWNQLPNDNTLRRKIHEIFKFLSF